MAEEIIKMVVIDGIRYRPEDAAAAEAANAEAVEAEAVRVAAAKAEVDAAYAANPPAKVKNKARTTDGA